MKYIIVGITMRSGEFEATQHMVFKVKDSVNIEEYAENIAMEFYSETEGADEDNSEYMFDNGSIVTYVSLVDEISKEEFKLFNKYL